MPKFHIRYRPRRLKQVIGNEDLISTISSILKGNDPPSTYLLHGPRGCGKTTLARIMAKEFGGKGRDIRLLNIGSTGGVEEGRRIGKEVHHLPMHGKSKVYILDECQRGSPQFFDSLLQVTEEPPKNVFFIFCTTEPRKLPIPLQSRCALKNQPVRLLSPKEIEKIINRIIKKEKANLEGRLIDEIISISEGCPREALVVLSEVIGLSSKEAKKVLANFSTEENADVAALCRELLKAQWSNAASTIKKIEKSGIIEPEGCRRIVLRYMQKVLLGNSDSRDDAAVVMEEFLESVFYTGWPGITIAAYRACVSEEEK